MKSNPFMFIRYMLQHLETKEIIGVFCDEMDALDEAILMDFANYDVVELHTYMPYINRLNGPYFEEIYKVSIRGYKEDTWIVEEPYFVEDSYGSAILATLDHYAYKNYEKMEVVEVEEFPLDMICMKEERRKYIPGPLAQQVISKINKNNYDVIVEFINYIAEFPCANEQELLEKEEMLSHMYELDLVQIKRDISSILYKEEFNQRLSDEKIAKLWQDILEASEKCEDVWALLLVLIKLSIFANYEILYPYRMYQMIVQDYF